MGCLGWGALDGVPGSGGLSLMLRFRCCGRDLSLMLRFRCCFRGLSVMPWFRCCGRALSLWLRFRCCFRALSLVPWFWCCGRALSLWLRMPPARHVWPVEVLGRGAGGVSGIGSGRGWHRGPRLRAAVAGGVSGS
jgi:hypothetical protein